MTTPNKTIMITVTGMGRETDTQLYYVKFNVFVKALDKYLEAYCTAIDYKLSTEEFDNFCIQFISNVDFTPVKVPYDKYMFEQIEAAAKDILHDLKFEELEGHG